MMHHPNMHHQPMSGHPPQHLPAHQGMPGHHQMPPHQMHRENRVPLGPSQGGGGMGAHGVAHGHGQAMGGMGGMPVTHHQQRPPHPIRAMSHHPPAPHLSVPQQMKPVRRGYLGGGYGAGALPPYAPPEPRPEPAAQPPRTGLCRPPSPILSPPTKPNSDFVVASPPAAAAPSPPPASDGEALAGEADAAAGDCEAPRPPPLANSKEKTPMCLVNELARYNKIKHQYRLTSETGPAHKKVFTVTLRLGEGEEYTAEGSSIKRAQHAAASAALQSTAYTPPPPRALPPHSAPHHHHRHSGAVMPTVELNALAMKLCQPAVYTSVPAVPAACRPRPPRLPPPYRLPPALSYPRLLPPDLIYRVRVCVGGRAWLGEGSSPQNARHDAAARALQELRPAPDLPPAAPPAAPAGDAAAAADMLSSEVKSPVSLVHELALKRSLAVLFSVKSERGPPHMRVFITACTVGEMETEGEGNGKKVSKRRAAERMLDEMRRRWPPQLLRARPAADRRKPPPAKKKPRNLIKEGGVSCTEAGGADNPISRLAVARHAVRARSPQYRVLEERGAARRREFLVQCDAPPHCATGLGPNKKTAKRRAAHNVLIAMEMANANETSANPSTTNSDISAPSPTDPNKNVNGDTKRKESEPATAGGANSEVRQPVPGVLLMDYHQRSGQPAPPNGVSEGGAAGAAGGGGSPGAKDQLLYLAQLLGFSVQFSDFPKRNHGEYLSLVSLSTEPPVMCHGGGPSTAHSHEQCARAALRALAAMGLDAPAALPAAGALGNGVSE